MSLRIEAPGILFFRSDPGEGNANNAKYCNVEYEVPKNVKASMPHCYQNI